MTNYRKRVQRRRERLAEEQGGLCFYCNKPMLVQPGDPEARNHPRQATLDHILPKSHGGSLSQNAVAACLECNQERATQPASQFVIRKLGASK